MKIVVAADHAAVETKSRIVEHLTAAGHSVEDLGPFNTDRVDYPDYARKACEKLAAGECDRVVLTCGSGIGMAMSANKVRGCRALVVHDAYEAEMSRRHNNANVACFGARSQGIEVILHALDAFLGTGFDGGRHEGRVAKMDQLDDRTSEQAHGRA